MGFHSMSQLISLNVPSLASICRTYAGVASKASQNVKNYCKGESSSCMSTGKTIGILYLENNLTPLVFTPSEPPC
jgi:hypothetical protein